MSGVVENKSSGNPGPTHSPPGQDSLIDPDFIESDDQWMSPPAASPFQTRHFFSI
jgi:hypothetical protein